MHKQALILAGGQGTRLAPLGTYLPKCLATVYNRPLIDYQLELLESVGVIDVYIAVSAQHHRVVQESLRCLQRPLHVHLLDEKQPQGVNALFVAARRMPSKPFWLLLGDIYYGCRALPDACLDAEAELVLFTRSYVDAKTLAAETANIVVEGRRVQKVQDKPVLQDVEGLLGWDGTALVSPAFVARHAEIEAWLAEHCEQAHLGDLFCAALAAGAVLHAQAGPQGHWININSPRQLLAASLHEASLYEARQNDISETKI